VHHSFLLVFCFGSLQAVMQDWLLKLTTQMLPSMLMRNQALAHSWMFIHLLAKNLLIPEELGLQRLLLIH